MKRSGLNFNRRTTTLETTMSKNEEASVVEWEMTPSGMLVQKRTAATDSGCPPPNFRVRVAYGASRHEISVSSQATFGELKKLLTAETGLQPAEQRLSFRGRERKDGSYLDTCGVKDGSKIVLTEDAWSIEKRLMEMQRNAKIQAARQKIEDVTVELDRLDDQVCAIEKSIGKGSKVAEVQITTLIEMLMRQAVKLDNISPQGSADACALKMLQGKRVQKCVETLDGLKTSNARILKPASAAAAVVQTKWESFDLLSPSPPPPPTTSPHWEFFD